MCAVSIYSQDFSSFVSIDGYVCFINLLVLPYQVGWLSDMLQWRHCAPTAPDTLDTYPFFDTDPFVVRVS